jgi:hypothetical protein
VEIWNLDAKWTPRGLRLQIWVGVVGYKCLKRFGGPGEIRTHDLFHAILRNINRLRAVGAKQKT